MYSASERVPHTPHHTVFSLKYSSPGVLHLFVTSRGGDCLQFLDQNKTLQSVYLEAVSELTSACCRRCSAARRDLIPVKSLVALNLGF